MVTIPDHRALLTMPDHAVDITGSRVQRPLPHNERAVGVGDGEAAVRVHDQLAAEFSYTSCCCCFHFFDFVHGRCLSSVRPRGQLFNDMGTLIGDASSTMREDGLGLT